MTLSLCACGGSAQPQIIYVETAPAAVDQPVSAPVYQPAPAAVSSPGKADLDAIRANITYPKHSAYLAEYKYGYVEPSGNNHAIYGFASSTATKSIATIEQDEDLVILAKQNNRYCVIVGSTQLAYWVNATYVALY